MLHRMCVVFWLSHDVDFYLKKKFSHGRRLKIDLIAFEPSYLNLQTSVAVMHGKER